MNKSLPGLGKNTYPKPWANMRNKMKTLGASALKTKSSKKAKVETRGIKLPL